MDINGVASPKFWGEPKRLTLGEQQYFCLGHRLLNNKMTGYAKIWVGQPAPWAPCLRLW